MDDLPEALRAHLAVVTPPLVPELRVYAAELIVPVWEATERLAGRPLPPPFWAFAWPGSQALARYVLDTPSLVRGCRVLDFATGNGLAAIAAARAGASTVLANDVDPLAIAAVAANCTLNGVAVGTSVIDLLDGDGQDCEVILAGDVCYEREPAERIVAWLRRCALQGAHVLLADPGRRYVPSSGLELVAKYAIPTRKELERAEEMLTRVVRVAPG